MDSCIHGEPVERSKMGGDGLRFSQFQDKASSVVLNSLKLTYQRLGATRQEGVTVVEV